MTRGPGRHSERNFLAAEQHYNAAEWPTDAERGNVPLCRIIIIIRPIIIYKQVKQIIIIIICFTCLYFSTNFPSKRLCLSPKPFMFSSPRLYEPFSNFFIAYAYQFFVCFYVLILRKLQFHLHGGLRRLLLSAQIEFTMVFLLWYSRRIVYAACIKLQRKTTDSHKIHKGPQPDLVCWESVLFRCAIDVWYCIRSICCTKKIAKKTM